jgi:histidinol-phosphate aminotransferase
MRMSALRLDKNESPLLWDGLRTALERLSRAPEALRRYPEEGALREAWAADAGVEASQALCTNGGDEAIELALRMIVHRGEADGERARALVARPTFSTFEILSSRFGIALTGPSYGADGSYPEEAMLEAVERDRPHGVVLVDPNNPTGTALSEGLVGRVREAAGDSALIVLDRAYADFAGLHDEGDVLTDDPGVVIIRSLSKSPGVAGLRIGALLGETSLIAEAWAERMIYSVNAAAVEIGIAALEDREARRRCVEMVDASRDLVRERLDRLGLAALQGPTNHALLLAGERGRDLLDACAVRGLLLRDLTGCDVYPGGVRMTLADPETMERAMGALEESLEAIGWSASTKEAAR